MKTLAFFVLFLCLWNSSRQRSTPEDDSYVAAVLEYNFASNTTTNLANYVHYIESAAAQSADIVVFPELTLLIGAQMEVPIHGLLREYPIPAAMPDLFDPVLVALSAAAAANEIYVVFNIPEVCNCERSDSGEYCPEAKVYYFNTNVVLDRNGAVIDRYRKINLFGEFSRSPALNPDLGVFNTDFGVTFGHFICFDLHFQVPAIQVVNKYNLTDVVFTAMWYSELPYLTAVQIQEGFAFANDVNFLASGANNVASGSAGSGIYSGKAGALISIMPGVPTTKLLVARVPKIPGTPIESPGPVPTPPGDTDTLFLMIDPSLTAHTSRLLVSGFQEFTLTQNEVSCRFRVRLNYNSGVHYEYRAATFDGVRTYSGFASGGSRVCSIISCTGTELSSCGTRFAEFVENRTAVFEELFIEASVPTPLYDAQVDAFNSVFFPLTVDVSTLPLTPNDYTYIEESNSERTVISFNLERFDKELYSVAIWGRVFEKDGLEPTPPVDFETGLEVEIDLVPDVEESSPGSASAVALSFVALLAAVAKIFIE